MAYDYPSGSFVGSMGSGSGSGPSTFLEELQARGIGVQEFHTDDAESRVVSALADGSSKDIATIMSDSGCIPLGHLLDTIDKLQEFGLISRSGNTADASFSLSSSGKRAAQMMGVWRGVS
jgi:hypothetical protein